MQRVLVRRGIAIDGAEATVKLYPSPVQFLPHGSAVPQMILPADIEFSKNSRCHELRVNDMPRAVALIAPPLPLPIIGELGRDLVVVTGVRKPAEGSDVEVTSQGACLLRGCAAGLLQETL